MPKLRYNRPAWVAHCRTAHAAQEAVRKDNDSMSHGIIPFGAVHHWADIERERLAQALSAPVPAWIIGWDASGMGLALTCPYCQNEHRHIVNEDVWQPDQPLEAICGKGSYRAQITSANQNTLARQNTSARQKSSSERAF